MKRHDDWLQKRFRRETGFAAEKLDTVAFANWLVSSRTTFAPGTWGVYKQAAIRIIRQQKSNVNEALEILDSPKKRTQKIERRTSARRSKFFTWDHWQQLDADLTVNAKSESCLRLRQFIRAGLATGLRFAEWPSAEIVRDGGRTFLRLTNAKSGDPLHGQVRHLEITGYRAETLSAIHDAITYASGASSGRIRAEEIRLQRILYRRCATLFRNEVSYSYYSCRHQFIANMKGISVPGRELSAMVGHLDESTAVRHYADASFAWKPDKIVDRPKALDS